MKNNTQKYQVALLGPFPPAVGGIASSLQNLLVSPLRTKYHFRCINTSSRKQGSEDYHYELVHKKLMRVIGGLFTFIGMLISSHIDIIHINTAMHRWSFWRDASYMVISRLFGKPVLFLIHSGNLTAFIKQQSKLKALTIKALLSLPSIIGVLSQEQLNKINELNIKAKIKTFPNMINIDLFTKDKPMDCRGKLKLPQYKYIVLFVAAHLHIEKGIHELVKAAATILEKRFDIYFLIVGTGGEEAKMKTLCKNHNLNQNIRFMGSVPHKTIIQLMNAADILTLPSHREQFPMIILEAMAAGLPVIATNVGAIPEIIVNNENGLIVNPKDYRVLQKGIEFLADNPKLCKEIGRKNTISVKTNYDLKIAIKPFGSTYQQLLSEQRK